jgi:RNA polymerase sigma factor (sigma-70 family)
MSARPSLDQVNGFRRGEVDAVDAVLAHAYRLAFRTAAAVLLHTGEAADVAQDVVLTAWRRRTRLREPDRLDAWLHRIAVREARRTLGRRTRQRALEQPLRPDVAADGRDHIERVAARDGARQALARLPERQRLALALRYVHDLSEREVADALGCGPGTAAALLSRARATLRTSPELASWALDDNPLEEHGRAATTRR